MCVNLTFSNHQCYSLAWFVYQFVQWNKVFHHIPHKWIMLFSGYDWLLKLWMSFSSIPSKTEWLLALPRATFCLFIRK